MNARLALKLERAIARGLIAPEAAEEIRRFARFLAALGDAGIEPTDTSSEAREARQRIYREHYRTDETTQPMEGKRQ